VDVRRVLGARRQAGRAEVHLHGARRLVEARRRVAEHAGPVGGQQQREKGVLGRCVQARRRLGRRRAGARGVQAVGLELRERPGGEVGEPGRGHAGGGEGRGLVFGQRDQLPLRDRHLRVVAGGALHLVGRAGAGAGREVDPVEL
jgi:hypothetical protein